MGFIDGTNREQTSYWSYEDMVDEENMVRVIDRYIDRCDLEQLGFDRTQAASTGRPGYSASSLAKLYVYGYETGDGSKGINPPSYSKALVLRTAFSVQLF